MCFKIILVLASNSMYQWAFVGVEVSKNQPSRSRASSGVTKTARNKIRTKPTHPLFVAELGNYGMCLIGLSMILYVRFFLLFTQQLFPPCPFLHLFSEKERKTSFAKVFVQKSEVKMQIPMYLDRVIQQFTIISTMLSF